MKPPIPARSSPPHTIRLAIPTKQLYSYALATTPWTVLGKSSRPDGIRHSSHPATLRAGKNYRAASLVFASGMAACAAIFGAVLRPGDIAVLPENAYFAARVLMQDYFAKMGIVIRLAPAPPATLKARLLESARLLWIETPSNPAMEICDIAALCERAHQAGALVAVDNTTATALGQRPLALGADFSVASDTKSMTGHSDILLGHVACRDRELLQKIEEWRTLIGAVLGPMEAWLALRSLGTLPLRLERSCENAQRIAEYLATRTDVVQSVLYPGLPTHPGHDIAARQMQYFGCVLSFNLADKAAAETFCSKAKLITESTSCGGTCTCPQNPPRTLGRRRGARGLYPPQRRAGA